MVAALGIASVVLVFALGGGFSGLLVSLGLESDPAPAPAAAAPTGGPTPSPPSATSTQAATPSPTVRPGTALAVAEALVVKGRAARTGFDRALYGTPWTDDSTVPDGHNGCDTRNDILRRDLNPVSVRAGTHGCLVVAGVLTDPYTGTEIAFTRGAGTSNVVQIDHVVALGDSWQKGAQSWTPKRRTAFANDPLNLQAVKGSVNESKGDGDTATWLPPGKAIRCAYVARQVSVKAKYALWTTAAERAAMERVLRGCPDQTLISDEQSTQRTASTARVIPAPPTPSVEPSAEPPPAPSPEPSPIAPPAPTPGRRFANCADMHTVYSHGVGRPGAHDETSGQPVTDFVSSLILYEANSGSDRDDDGVACEAH